MVLGTQGGLSHHTHGQEAVSFLHLIQLGTPAHRMVPPVSRVGLTCSINLIETIPHRKAQRLISSTNPDSSRLTISTIIPIFHLQSSRRVRNISDEPSAQQNSWHRMYGWTNEWMNEWVSRQRWHPTSWSSIRFILFSDFCECPSLIFVSIDYACALQKDILVQGRLYLSENWLCFYSNIFRWETTVRHVCIWFVDRNNCIVRINSILKRNVFKMIQKQSHLYLYIYVYISIICLCIHKCVMYFSNFNTSNPIRT